MSLKTEWQPIETAPKDGTDLWLYVPKELPAQVVGYWDSDGFWQYREQLVADVAGELDSPSHWMPLPTPPSSSLILEREEAGGETSDSSHLAVPTNGPESLSSVAGVPCTLEGGNAQG